MYVVIAGAGLTGPLLAQGLVRAGIDVTIVERRPSAEHQRIGYRIHLDPHGDLGLRANLPSDLYRLAVLTAGQPGSGVRILDTDLTVTHEMIIGQPADTETAGRHLTVDRQTLREILLAGLEDQTRLGASFDGYTVLGDGSVRASLDDGSTLDAGLLVGADGAGSRIRERLLPQLEVITIEQLNIFGRIPLTEQTLESIPAAALDGFSNVLGADGRTMPLAAHRFAHPPQPTADRIRPGLRLSAAGDYLMWVFSTPPGTVPDNRSPAVLRDFVAGQVAEWHPALTRIVEASAPDSVQATAVRTSRRPEPWEPGPVTLIGDAAHPMIPAGIGAAVALADAARLTEQLERVQHGLMVRRRRILNRNPSWG